MSLYAFTAFRCDFHSAFPVQRKVVFLHSQLSVSAPCTALGLLLPDRGERTGSSNRPWLSRQIGSISSGIGTRAPCTNIQIQPSLSTCPLLLFVTLPLAPFPLPFYPSSVSWVGLIKSIDLLPHLTWRPTWPVDQPAYLASASSPLAPDSTLLSSK